MSRLRYIVAAGLVLAAGLLVWSPTSALFVHPGTQSFYYGSRGGGEGDLEVTTGILLESGSFLLLEDSNKILEE